MKSIIYFLIGLASFSTMAQETLQEDSYMVLTTNPEQLKPILLAASDLDANGEFKIVFYGGKVTELLQPEIQQYIELAEKQNVKISVCKMSLDHLKIDPLKIPAQIEIVDNAFLYAFQLQKNGYKTLNL